MGPGRIPTVWPRSHWMLLKSTQMDLLTDPAARGPSLSSAGIRTKTTFLAGPGHGLSSGQDILTVTMYMPSGMPPSLVSSVHYAGL